MPFNTMQIKQNFLIKDSSKPSVMIVVWNGSSDYLEFDPRYYPSVANKCPQVGKDLANVLLSLGVNGNKIHCIGHSLGKN